MTSIVRVIMCCALIAAVLAGCKGDNPRNQDIPELSRIDAQGERIADRPLSQLEVDSLRVLKDRLAITRDDYWMGFGGVLGTDYLEVWYPQGATTVAHGMYTFLYVADARTRMARFFGKVPATMLTVNCTPTLKEYRETTGRDWWQYGLIEDDIIIMQPVHILVQRGILHVAARHEYIEWALPKLTGGRAPRWLVQGLTAEIAAEEFVLEAQWKEFGSEPERMSVKDIERALKASKDRRATRIATYNAFRMVKKMIDDHGEEKMAALVMALGEGNKIGNAAKEVYGASWDDLIEQSLAWEVGGAVE